MTDYQAPCVHDGLPCPHIRPVGAVEWPAMSIGDVVLDRESVAWRVLSSPLGESCAGSFAALDGSLRQRYGEHMAKPVTVLEESAAIAAMRSAAEARASRHHRCSSCFTSWIGPAVCPTCGNRFLDEPRPAPCDERAARSALRPTCPACGAQHIVWRLIRWPWQHRTRFVCYGCFYRWSVPDA